MTDNLVASFTARYCPPIDTSTLLAILSDHDLSDPQKVMDAEKALDEIRLDAFNEEQSGFDPSGCSSAAEVTGPNYLDGDSNDHTSSKDISTPSLNSDLTELSQTLGSVNICKNGDDLENDQRGISAPEIERIEKLDDPSKQSILKEMFPSLSESTITHSIERYRGQWTSVIDDLLTRCYYLNPPDGEEMVSDKGIDAFSSDRMWANGRQKRKGKKKSSLDKYHDKSTSSRLPFSPSNENANAWRSLQEDVEFVRSRMGLSTQQVSSAYHRNGLSLSSTIVELLEAHETDMSNGKFDTELLRVKAHELNQEYPSITFTRCLALIRITGPSDEAAHELANSIVSTLPHSNRTPDPRMSQIIPNYAPLNFLNTGNKSTAQQEKYKSQQTAIGSKSNLHPLALATSYNLAYNHAISQAKALNSRGRSSNNGLMSQSVGYYSQISRDLAVKRDAAYSEAADQLVARQSTPRVKLDLHGVNVRDAVRIAREKTEEWWNYGGRGVIGLDGRRGEGSGGPGFIIVVGQGRHSEGGKGRLGPAVRKMLLQDGWKIDDGTGMLIVTGKKQ